MSQIIDAAKAGDSATVLREMRVRSLMSPYYFVKVVLGYPDLTYDLHGVELERFIGLLEAGHTKQWIEFPRAHFKTTCWTIGCSIWLVLPVTAEDRAYALDVLKIPVEAWERRTKLHNQNYAQLVAFESATNAGVKLTEIKGHFERNTRFRACFPEIAYQGTPEESPWSTQALKIRRTGDGFRIAEATWEAMGVDAALQSRHYDVIWEDDIVGKAATEQPTVMQTTIRWHGLLAGVMGGPNLKMGTLRIGISNRWGYNDLNSHIRRTDPEFLFHTRALIEQREDGTEDFIFAGRYDRFRAADGKPDLEKFRISMGLSRYDFACQFMNRPFLEGDREVDIEKLHRYRVDEGGKIICSCGYEVYASQLRRYGHYDPNTGRRGARSNSLPMIAVVGIAADRHVFLLEYWGARVEYGKIFDQLVRMNDIWWPEVWTYEDAAGQNMAEFYLKQMQKNPDYKASEHKYFRRIEGVPTGGRAPEVRIRDGLFPVFEKGKFSCRSTHTLFLNMLETWPAPVPDHDYDLLDCLAQGPKFWRPPSEEGDINRLKREEEEFVASIGRPYSYGSPSVQ